MTLFLNRIFIVGLMLCAGCVTVASDQGTFQTSLGSTSSRDAVTEVRDLLQNRYGYSLDRQVVSKERILFRTDWKTQMPTKQERNQGITKYRTRVEVRARPKRRMGNRVSDYSISFEAQCEVKRGGSDWRNELPESRKDYFKEMTQLLENEFKGGLRTM